MRNWGKRWKSQKYGDSGAGRGRREVEGRMGRAGRVLGGGPGERGESWGGRAGRNRNGKTLVVRDGELEAGSKGQRVGHGVPEARKEMRRERGAKELQRALVAMVLVYAQFTQRIHLFMSMRY